MSNSYSKTRILVECALMIAIGTVLSNIKIFTMPNGGSVTLLSMLPFVLVSFRHGVKWGLFTGLVNGCLQMLLGFWAPPTPTFLYFLGEVLLDYLIAFMALGTAELFARPFKNRMVGVAFGTFMAGVHDGSSIRGEYGFRMELYAVDVVFAVAQRHDLSFWADRRHFEAGRQTVVRHYPRVVTSYGELLGDALENIVFFRLETRSLYAVEHIG